MSEQKKTKRFQNSLIFAISALFSLLLMGAWFAIFFFQAEWPLPELLPISWHVHEMVFGFGMLVVAGYFLIQSKHTPKQNAWVLTLLMLWSVARILPFVSSPLALHIMLACELLFSLVLIFLIIIQGGRHSLVLRGVFLVLTLFLALSNLIYYLGLNSHLHDGERIGLFSGLYVLMMIFITISESAIRLNGAKDELPLDHNLALSWVSALLTVVLALSVMWNVILLPSKGFVALNLVAACLFVIVAGYRVFAGRWNDLLNAAVAVAYLLIAIGFGMKALVTIDPLFPRLANHAFAIGGVGLMALAIMITPFYYRRKNHKSEFVLTGFLMFGAIFGATLIFLFAPLWLEPKYVLIVAAAQLGWIVGFSFYFLLVAQTPRVRIRRRRRTV